MKTTYIRIGDFLRSFGTLMLSRRQLTEIIITVIRMLMRSEIAIREHYFFIASQKVLKLEEM